MNACGLPLCTTSNGLRAFSGTAWSGRAMVGSCHSSEALCAWTKWAHHATPIGWHELPLFLLRIPGGKVFPEAFFQLEVLAAGLWKINEDEDKSFGPKVPWVSQVIGLKRNPNGAHAVHTFFSPGNPFQFLSGACASAAFRLARVPAVTMKMANLWPLFVCFCYIAIAVAQQSVEKNIYKQITSLNKMQKFSLT